MYLSSILGCQVYNQAGEKIGKISDVVVTHLNSPLPAVVGFTIQRGLKKKAFFVPILDCASFEKCRVNLCTDIINFTPFIRRENEVLLSKEVLDRQIVDVKERHLTRINDIELTRTNGNLFVKSVDVSFRSLLNRLGLPTWGFIFKYNSIPWKDIQFLGVDLPVKVKVDYERLETLHPADIARFIFRGPGYRKGSKIIQSLDEEIAADVVESLPLDIQVNIISNMEVKDAADILSEMESHRAVDVLSEFDTTKREQVLQLMQEKQAAAVRSLLSYPPGTVGAIMKVEYVYVPQNFTVEELYEKLRTMPKLPEFLLYFFVTESLTNKKLVGVVSVWELFKANSRERIENIMVRNVVVAKPLEEPKRVLKRMTQYDLSALPVVGKDRHLLGIVTLNDAIKLVIPKSWQTRVGLR